MQEQEDKVVYTQDQFNHILEILVNTNKAIATKFMIQKLQEAGFYVMDRAKLESRLALLQVLEEVHSRNPDLEEEDIMKDILEVQREVRASKR